MKKQSAYVVLDQNGGQFRQQNRVYSIGKMALTLPSKIPNGSYLYLEVKEMKTEFLGSFNGNGPGRSGAVWDKENLSPTIMTCSGGGNATTHYRGNSVGENDKGGG